jgi:hypothetical protein
MAYALGDSLRLGSRQLRMIVQAAFQLATSLASRRFSPSRRTGDPTAALPTSYLFFAAFSQPRHYGSPP